MPVVKIRTYKRENPYVQIDHRPLNDPRLSWKAKGILAYLLSKPADWVILSADLITKSTDARDSVQAGMAELAKAGYARLETIRENGRVAGNQWVIMEDPNGAEADALPITGFSVCRVFRLSGNPLLLIRMVVIRMEQIRKRALNWASPTWKTFAATLPKT